MTYYLPSPHKNELQEMGKTEVRKDRNFLKPEL